MMNRAHTQDVVRQRLSLLRLSRLHAHVIDPERFSECVPGLSASARQALLQSPRFMERISARIASRFPLPLLSLDNDDPHAHLLLRGRENLRLMIRRAGAIWHAGVLRRVVLATERRALDASLGPDIIPFALHHVHLAPRTMPAALQGDAADVVDRSGAACLAVWMKDWPMDTVSRVNIMLPAKIWPAHASIEHATYASKIMEAVLGAGTRR
jgi:hypothetical protein